MLLNSDCLLHKPAICANIDELCVNYVVKVFTTLFDGRPELMSTDMASVFSIQPKYNRMLDFLCRLLQDKDQLSCNNGRLMPLWSESVDVSLARSKAEILIRYPEYKGLYDVLDHCFTHYIDVLQGSQSVISVLFPGGENTFLQRKLNQECDSFTNANQFPEILADYFNDHICDFTRIVEIGAGSGHITWPLLERIKTLPETYLFTDISRAFLLDAEAFAEQCNYHFMQFERLDINHPAESGYQQQFDFALAYNVIHAAVDIEKSLRHVSDLLKPGGVLMLMELTKPYLWQHLIWGLTDGWWCFADSYRVNQPTIPVVSWQQAIEHVGLKLFAVYPHAQSDKAYDSHLLFCKK